ncbi:UNVERIFIED_CONTAM: hypothetical protein HDU68_002052 [Siphonaria sp. JEL0065]|nr:hypothetical protein HDU68_002052 [Siphonaria sp. JEL0065]
MGTYNCLRELTEVPQELMDLSFVFVDDEEAKVEEQLENRKEYDSETAILEIDFCNDWIAKFRVIHNVMTVVFENQDYAKVMKDSYFGTELPQKGLLLENMNGVMHPSQPNYLAMISGSTHRVFYDFNVDISAVDIRNNDTRCANIVHASQLDSDARDGNLPNYIFFTPDMNNDGHDTDLSYASKWLQNFLELKLVDPVYRNTLFFITFDESETYFGNHIYSLLIGAGVVPGTVDKTKYTHYSFLATVEALFGLGNLGQNDAKAPRIPLC